MTANSTEAIERGLAHLRARDPIMADLIERVGPFQIRVESDLFRSLVRAIISQQISTNAARSIYGRVLALTGGAKGDLAAALNQASLEELRGAGVSPQKASYLKDLAIKSISGTIQFEGIELRSNDEIINELTQVKGIGKWTVQMLLIFSLGRLDVFPADDLGVRTAIKRLYRKRSVPKARQLGKFQKLWHPYASIASWYCWRSLDL